MNYLGLCLLLAGIIAFNWRAAKIYWDVIARSRSWLLTIFACVSILVVSLVVPTMLVILYMGNFTPKIVHLAWLAYLSWTIPTLIAAVKFHRPSGWD